MTNNKLAEIVNRIERLEDERAVLAADVKDIYTEAKSSGYDPKIIKKLIALRKKDAATIAEEEALLDTYRSALGMLEGTPLGDYAKAQKPQE